MVHHGEQRVSIVCEYRRIAALRCGRRLGVVVVMVTRSIFDVLLSFVTGHERRHVQFGGERYERGYFPISLTRVFETLEMKAGDNRQRLQRQLLGRFLICATVGAFDLSAGTQVFGPGEAFETSLERPRTGDVEGYIPKRIDSSRNAAARLADYIALQTASENLIYYTIATSVAFFLLSRFIHSVSAMSTNDHI